MLKRVVSCVMLTLLLGTMLFSAINIVEGEGETHDLEVSLTATEKKILFRDDGKGHLSSGNSTVLNATVVNKGDFNESDVALQLLINGIMVLNAITPRLEINCAFWTAYFWTPSNADYNLTVHAPPVSGEDITTNNVVTKWVRVGPDQCAIVVFTYSPPPPPPGPVRDDNVTFDASASYDPDWGNITIYSWNFNGTIRNHTAPIYIYKFPGYGNATVTLTLYDTEGKSNNTSANITVYARPIASFRIDKPGPYYVNETLTFNATASYDPDNSTASPNNGIVNYTWDFGDTNINATLEPVINHTYANNDTYQVKLTVTDSDNLSNSSVQWIIIGLGTPIADFEITQPSPYFVNEVLTFNSSKSKADGGNIASYFWNWNDSTTNTTTSPIINHTFTQQDVYNVTLTVMDSDNKTSLPTYKSVKVILQVLLEVKPTSVSSNPGERFNISITVANVENLFSIVFRLTWPGGTDRLIDVKDATPGNFTGSGDWFDPEYKPVQGTIWINATRDKSGTGVDGNWTVAVILFEVRDKTGNHTLSFTEWSLKNSTQGEIPPTTIDGYFYTTKPVANFTYSPPTPSVNQTITFDASASYDPDSPSAPILNYTWDFGDGNITSITGIPEDPPSPIMTHKYESNDTYTVILFVTDDDGETWNFTQLITVGYVHDVAVIDVDPRCNETAGILPINVTVKNKGNTSETFDVTLNCTNATGSYVIETQTVSLSNNSEINLTFHWDITKVKYTKGDYNISAYATPVEGEVYTKDNTCDFEGTIKVNCPGNVNEDDVCDIQDYQIVKNAVPSRPSDPEWEQKAKADLNQDGVVDVTDYQIVKKLVGKKDP